MSFVDSVVAAVTRFVDDIRATYFAPAATTPAISGFARHYLSAPIAALPMPMPNPNPPSVPTELLQAGLHVVGALKRSGYPATGVAWAFAQVNGWKLLIGSPRIRFEGRNTDRDLHRAMVGVPSWFRPMVQAVAPEVLGMAEPTAGTQFSGPQLNHRQIERGC